MPRRFEKLLCRIFGHRWWVAGKGDFPSPFVWLACRRCRRGGAVVFLPPGETLNYGPVSQ